MTKVIEKPTLFNLNTKTITPAWIDPTEPLKVPENPLHYQAHKLQLMLERMDAQAQNNPAQFNSSNYLNMLDKFTTICEAINNGKKSIDDILDTKPVEESRNDRATPEMGDRTPDGVDSGVSTDNPFTR